MITTNTRKPLVLSAEEINAIKDKSGPDSPSYLDRAVEGAVLAKIDAQQTWQPIDTAPKLTVLLLCEARLEKDGDSPTARHHAFSVGMKTVQGTFIDTSEQIHLQPTHWMAIPDFDSTEIGDA